MAKVLMRVMEVVNKDQSHHGWMIRCPNPDCYAHEFDSRWTFNGDLLRPTFRASMLARWTQGEEKKPMVCHSYVTDGKIEFLSDCTHELAGKTVELPYWEDDDEFEDTFAEAPKTAE